VVVDIRGVVYVFVPDAKRVPPVEAEYQSNVFPGSFTPNVTFLEGGAQNVPLMGVTETLVVITTWSVEGGHAQISCNLNAEVSVIITLYVPAVLTASYAPVA
jgi:hypothetical protein